METAELIQRLTDDAKPVRPLSGSPFHGVLSMTFLAFAAFGAIAALALVLFPAREHLDSLLSAEISILNLLFLFFVALAFAWSLSQTRIPGASFHVSTWVAVAGLACLSFVLFIAGVQTPDVASFDLPSHVGGGWLCSERILLLSLPALILGGVYLLRGAPVSLIRASTLLAGFAITLAAAALPLTCESSEAFHLLVSHLLSPLLLGTLAFVGVGRLLMRW